MKLYLFQAFLPLSVESVSMFMFSNKGRGDIVYLGGIWEEGVEERVTKTPETTVGISSAAKIHQWLILMRMVLLPKR